MPAPTAPSAKPELTAHPLADIFPLMEGADFDALVKDIEDNWLREPIALYEDKILDGRNRYRAVVKAKLQHKLKEENFRTYPGPDPLAFVISANVLRRHLNESQRALVAARIVTTKLGDNQHKNGSISTDKAAKMLSVSEATVKTAKEVVEKAAPEIKEKVLKGELRLGAAKDIIDKPKDQQLAELERVREQRKAEQEKKRKVRLAAKTTSKANQAMTDLDDFKKKWASFNEMQRKGFVVTFMDELAKIIEDERKQRAMIGDGGSVNLATQIATH